MDLTIAKEDLSDWMGRKVTDAEVEYLAETIGYSSVPEAIATILDGMPSHRQVDGSEEEDGE
jgi:hypothetical protein